MRRGTRPTCSPAATTPRGLEQVTCGPFPCCYRLILISCDCQVTVPPQACLRSLIFSSPKHKRFLTIGVVDEQVRNTSWVSPTEMELRRRNAAETDIGTETETDADTETEAEGTDVEADGEPDEEEGGGQAMDTVAEEGEDDDDEEDEATVAAAAQEDVAYQGARCA